MKNLSYFLSILIFLIVSRLNSLQSQELSSDQIEEPSVNIQNFVNGIDSLNIQKDLDSLNNPNTLNQMKELNKPNEANDEVKQTDVPSENELVPLSKENIPEQIMQQDMEKPEETVDEEKNPE